MTAPCRCPLLGRSWLLLVLLGLAAACTPSGTPSDDSSPEGKQTSGHAAGKPARPPGDAHSGGSETSKKHTNRLAQETSPYLLLHAHNPVDWYPWGPEALEKARKENKLIFLSIGYFSCHWCHVMERETFSDPEVARFLNKHFVCIKVDREERPDVDEVYMTALHVYYQLTGNPSGGGWPLSMFLTPRGLPFAGGTYFPPRPKRGLPGFLDVARRMQQAWEKNPRQVERMADVLAQAVRRALSAPVVLKKIELSEEPIQNLFDELGEQFDPDYGGFGYTPGQDHRPKFPEPGNLFFLLHRWRQHRDEQAGRMLVKTLDEMAAGGIRDHLGGGFHRYSTDRRWEVPHFEKMLYDNAQLLELYALAWHHTRQRRYRRVAQQTAEFLLRRMRSPQGAFYAALDAESEGQEGRYYVWTREELAPFRKHPHYPLLAELYGLDGPPNFEGRWVLRWRRRPEQVAARHNISLEELWRRIDPLRKQMLQQRSGRKRPGTDVKILTAWNGLAIAALARAGQYLEEPRYTQAAAEAATFVLKHLRRPDGKLYRTWTSGKAQLPGYLVDYAATLRGLVVLHEVSGQAKWLRPAKELADKQRELFAAPQGGFYYTSEEHDELFVRIRGPADGPVPSGNSLAALGLLRLGRLTAQQSYTEQARGTFRAFWPELENMAQAYPWLVLALDRYLDTQPKREQSPPGPQSQLPLVAPGPK